MPNSFLRNCAQRTLMVLALATSIQGVRAQGLSCSVLPELFKAYLASHYSVHELTDEVKAHTVEQYIKDLDSSKTTLLESDVIALRKDLLGLFKTMKSGDCKALERTQELLTKRAGENEAFVRGFLDDKYKLDETVELITDSDKRGWSKTATERDDLLRKFIHFQISNYLLSDMSLTEGKKQLTHRYELATKRVKDRKMDDILSTYADAFATALDPHSSFFSKDSLEEFRISMSLSLEGIGATLSFQDGYTVVEEILPGGAADRAKVLKPKDKIIAVAQDGEKPVSVIDMELREVVKLIRGKKGTKVKLTLLRQVHTLDRMEVSIVRDKINMKEAEARLRVENRKVGAQTYKLGVIDLPSFYGEGEKGKRSCYTDVKRLLAEAAKKKIDGLVLNLEHNGGGLLDDAVKMSGLFIKKGGIVATQGSHHNVEVLADEDDGTDFSGPMVVLTSRASASASEILAGALRDYKRALIVGGDHTFGKGSVQAVVPLPRDLGAIKVTTGMFFLPGGVSTQHQGVKGDVVMPSTMSTDDFGEKFLDYSLPPQKIDAFLSADADASEPAQHWKPITPEEVKVLADKSAVRIAKDAKFAEIQKDTEEAKKNKGIIRLADVLKKSKKEKKKNKEEEKKTTAERLKDVEAPYINESLNILADLVQIEKGSGSPVAASK